MAKKSIPKKYVKLGPKAGGFSDPYSRFKVLKGQIKELVTQEERRSGKIAAAIRGGHLVVVSESEYEAWSNSKIKAEKVKDENPDEPTLEELLEEKTKAELTRYYEDNYQVSEEDVEAFSKMKHPGMVAELVGLAEEAGDEE